MKRGFFAVLLVLFLAFECSAASTLERQKVARSGVSAGVVSAVGLAANGGVFSDTLFDEMRRASSKEGATFLGRVGGHREYVSVFGDKKLKITGAGAFVGVAEGVDEAAYALFFEGGAARYLDKFDKDSLSGKVYNYGGGLAFRNGFGGGGYFELSARLGKVKAVGDDVGERLVGRRAYFVGHVGFGKTFFVASDRDSTLFASAEWGHLGAGGVSGDAGEVKLGAAKSLRLSAGVRLRKDISQNWESYIRGVYEYEMSDGQSGVVGDFGVAGSAGGSGGGDAAGVAVRSGKVRGSTGVGELGFRYDSNLDKKGFVFGISLKGWGGKRYGWGGGAQMGWAF